MLIVELMFKKWKEANFEGIIHRCSYFIRWEGGAHCYNRLGGDTITVSIHVSVFRGCFEEVLTQNESSISWRYEVWEQWNFLVEWGMLT